MKYKVRINQDKLEEVKAKLKPGKSWWALVGIVLFFFLPEIAAFFWGDEISKYFSIKEQTSVDSMHKFLYHQLQSLGENSIFNIVLGVIFTIWFFKGRKEEENSKPPKVNL